MLKAEITLSDLVQDATLADGKIKIGRGHITPYPHAALETLLIRTELQWFVCVRERLAGTAVENRFSEATVSSEAFSRLLLDALLWPLDYVIVEVAQVGCRLKIRTGVCGVAPVYCRASHGKLEVSWDFGDLLKRNLFIDTEVASHYLALNAVYASRQLFTGITMLTERASFYVEPEQALYQYPAPIPPPEVHDGDTEDSAIAHFEALLQDIISRRPIPQGQAAVQLSGGMDSATVATAMTRTLGPISSRGILINDANRQAQIQRRRQIIEHLGLSDGSVEIREFPPSLDLTPDLRRSESPYKEYYLEAFDALWSDLYDHGCQWLFTGLGGDELFLPYLDEAQPDDEHARRFANMRNVAESLLTPSARNAARTLRSFDAPRPPIPLSALLGQACQAPNFLKHGLWPVNPLSHPELVVFCHRLPRKWRRSRNFMRRYLNMRLGNEVFPQGYAKETFVRVLPDLIADQATTISAQLHECALADLGLINRDAVLSLLGEVAATRSDMLTAPLASFLWLERFVRRVA